MQKYKELNGKPKKNGKLFCLAPYFYYFCKLMRRNNYEFLTTAPVPKVIGTLAVPTIISMMVTSIYSLADTYFVSQLNTQATAAVGIVFTVMSIFQAVGYFYGHGSGNYIAMQLGAKNTSEARTMAVRGFAYAILTGVVLALLGMLFLPQLGRWLGSTETIYPYTLQYLKFILIGCPFIIGSLTLNLQLRFRGDALFAMFGILSGAILNILLDPILIFYADMGISGAGLATLISQMTSFLVLLAITLCLRPSKSSKPITLNSQFSTLNYIFRGGMPSITRQGLGTIATLLLNLTAAGFGDAAVAAMSIVTRITFLVYSAVIGLGHGFQPLCGFCYGAHLYHRVSSGFWFSVRVGTAFLTIVTIVGFAFTNEIIALFRDDPEVIAIGDQALRWQLLTYPLGAFIMHSNMMMQTVNRPLEANLLAAARRGLFFIPFILILPPFFGLFGLIITQACADICAFLLTLPIVLGWLRELKINNK